MSKEGNLSMKTTKIYIRDLFGVALRVIEGGKSYELTGPKGSGKTSVLDAIRFALTNRSDREFIIRQGADEGEIIIETNTGLSIDRKIRESKADFIKVKDGNLLQNRPAEFLSGIFTPLQLNPVEFTQMSRQEKNRVILSLIEFDWDINWIQEKFGEIPPKIDYTKHILEVLSDIQADNGVYYQSRRDLNSRALHVKKSIEDIARTIPKDYEFAKWDAYSLADAYAKLEKIKDHNGKIARAKAFKDSYDNKLRGLQADRDIALAAADKAIQNEREGLLTTIERLRAEIKAAEDKIYGLDSTLADKKAVIQSKYQEDLAKLDADTGTAAEWADKEPQPVDTLQQEVGTAEAMKKHLNEYQRMLHNQAELEKLTEDAAELTRKIDLARELPGEILKTATLPIAGLTVENGIPLINGLPISNLSDGELLDLCVEVAICRPGGLEIILIDGAERLDSGSRERLYAKCKEKGLQLIATRVTDSDELEVVEL
jgi:DNA repair exonuclease SbcCD ATPase subunit